MALSFGEFLKQRQSGKSVPQIAAETPESYGARKNQTLSFAEFQSRMQQGKNAAQIANEQAQKSRESTQPAAGKPTGEELIQPIKTRQNTGAATPQSRFTRQFPLHRGAKPLSLVSLDSSPFRGAKPLSRLRRQLPLHRGALRGKAGARSRYSRK